MKYFPVCAWQTLPVEAKPYETDALCPSLGFINDYLAPRDDKHHHAIDIFVPEGTPVVAPVSGFLWANKRLGDNFDLYSYFERGGWHCYLWGDDGNIYYFSHLHEYPLKDPGERIQAGEVLGYVGKSGIVYGCPHLHYSVFKIAADTFKGRPINPYNELDDIARSNIVPYFSPDSCPTIRIFDPIIEEEVARTGRDYINQISRFVDIDSETEVVSEIQLQYFPLVGWEQYSTQPKPRDPSKLCPKFSFIDDYLAKRKEYLHHAIDVFVPIGTPVIAVTDGVMWPNEERGDTWKSWKYFEKGGWHCYLYGDNGFIFYYAHLMNHPIVRPGQKVRAGQLLGFSGDSGNVRGNSCPHLHYAAFRIRADGSKGSSVNPFQALKAAPVVRKPYKPGDSKWIWIGGITVAALLAAVLTREIVK